MFFVIINGFSQEIDTIKIEAGKPYAFLISIAEYPVQIVGSNLKNEKNELLKNFKDYNLEVILIEKHSFLLLESGQGLDMTNINNPYTATAYWSGNNNEEIELFNDIHNTTEFIAAKLGVEVKSEYATNAIKYKEEVNQLLSQNNFTENSKITLKKYLQMYQNAVLTINEEFWYMQEIPKIKNLKIFLVENGKDKLYKNLDFNSLGQITYEAESNSNGWRKYHYEEDRLHLIEKIDRNITINYDDNKMILSENVGAATETTIYWVENGMLLSKRYTLMEDDYYADQNVVTEEKIEKNEIVRYSNGQVIERNHYTPYGIFPYTHTYTSYQSAAADQEPNFMQQIKYKIEKKRENIFEKYYSEAEQPTDKDIYKKSSTIYLNENNLITKIVDSESEIKVEYTYY